VKDPNPEPVVDTQTTAPPSATAGAVDTAMPEVPAFTGTESFRAPSGAGLSGRIGGSQGRKDPSNIGLGEDDSQGRDTLTYEKPAMDIFKAIFASDDEDSDGEDERNRSGRRQDLAPSASSGTTQSVPISKAPALQLLPISKLALWHRHLTNRASNGAAPETIDIASFKPTFIPREGKKSKDKGQRQERQEEKG
jgi:G patch domain-containing protein 1